MGLFVLLVFTVVAWVVGLSLVIVLSDDIDARDQQHYHNFVLCFGLSLLFGFAYSFLRLGVSACCVKPRARSGRRATCRCFFVDSLTLMVYQEFTEGSVKEKSGRVASA